MKDGGKTKEELIKERKFLREDREKSVFKNISEYKEVAKRLKDSEVKYRTIFENTCTATMIIEEDRIISMANTQCEKLSGYSKEEVENKMKWTNFVIPEDLERMKKYHIARRKAGGKSPTEYEFHLKDKKGNIRDIFLKIGMIPNTKKSIVSLVDITERKKLERELKTIKSAIASSINANAIALADLKGNLTYVNSFFLKMWGYEKDKEVLGQSVIKFWLNAEDAEKIVKNLFDKGSSMGELVGKRKDGSIFYVQLSASMVTDKSGKPINMVGSFINITERKQEKEDLSRNLEREQILGDIVRNTPIAIAFGCTDGRLENCNAAFSELTGYSIEELKGISWNEVLAPAKQSEVEAGQLRKLTPTEKSVRYEKEYIRKNGRIVPIELVVTAKFDAEDNLVYYIAFVLDITKRKKAEQNMKSIKNELQMIMDSVPAIIFYKDTEGRIIRANKTYAYLLKMSVKDMVGKTTEELFPREQAENMRKGDQEVIISGKPKRNIIQPYDTPEGTRWAITDKMPYKDKEGKVTGVIGLAKDITVQRKSEEELQQSYERLKKTMDATIETVSKIVEVKDPYTAGHQLRVSQLTTAIAKELNLSPDKIEGIRIASLIHDIGKISIPTEILSKSTTLTDIEFSLIKEHSRIGYDILKAIDFSYPVAQIVLQHHEKINGSGYPGRLKGNEILLEAKIIGVADVVEAMSSHRPYRPALGIDKALKEISQNKGTLYDSKVVEACVKLFRKKGFEFGQGKEKNLAEK